MSKRIFAISIMGLVLSGCTTMEERVAKKVGCTKDEAQVRQTMAVPAYKEYEATCHGVTYVCRYAPFTQTCSPKTEKKP